MNQSRGPLHIAIEGPIGAGKTTLAKRLAASFDSQLLLEQAEDNPFLKRFYRHRRDNALATQLFFLFQRAQLLEQRQQGDLFNAGTVADFMIEKDPLFAGINLDSHELALYQKVYEQLAPEASSPDLTIYLQAPTSTLLSRVRQRGILSEQAIEKRYLEQINEAYAEFFLYYDASPLLIVNADEIDFANSDDQYQELVDYLLEIRSGRHYFNPTFF